MNVVELESAINWACFTPHDRAVHILPNRFLETVGEHSDFPIDRIRLSRDGCLLASCSHDQKIKFWGVGHLKDVVVEPGSKNKPSSTETAGNDDFFADLWMDKPF